MLVVLVGTADERQRLRAELDRSALTIAGEFATLADARASGIDADAIVLGTPLRHAGRVDYADDRFEEPLTARELEVLERLVEGLSNKAIARRLEISDQTVKFHVASICGKLGAANRTDAVRRAARRGLISL